VLSMASTRAPARPAWCAGVGVWPPGLAAGCQHRWPAGSPLALPLPPAVCTPLGRMWRRMLPTYALHCCAPSAEEAVVAAPVAAWTCARVAALALAACLPVP
jgi:hypothetical protein